MQASSLAYDPRDRDSILAYAERLVGNSLREILDELPPTIDFSSHKGGFGTALERHYFGYEPNSRPVPDFAEAGIELKATPLKTVRKKLVAKERLVLGMIDYMAIDSEEWESSTFIKKNSHLLLVFYLHEADTDPRDFVVRIVRLWDFPAEDLEIIRQDWEKIVAKVREGKAHELSEGDTLYLGACTKSSDSTKRRSQPRSPEPAKPRAFSLKASYMNTIIDDSLARREAHRREIVIDPRPIRSVAAADVIAGLNFEDAIANLFTPYIGLTADEIAERLGVTAKPGAKNYYAVLTNRMLGLDAKERAAEFEKADIQVKTMRLTTSGRPKEDISFPAFKYVDLVEQDWDTSDLKDALSKRFFFVIYQLGTDGTPALVGTRFWTMPVSDVERLARRCFDETQHRIREDRAEYLPKKSENRAVHVRPHGRDSADVIATPSGRLVCRKSFWLNGTYIKEQLGL
ncbi:MAG: Sau3AI family type II restriction endonuclease [Actinomycetota bacterium]|nr:Sau3AI family type II restriction endonuclease [Actinomycetota bacterium]